MIFDARPNAPLIFKERLLWLLFLAPFFFLVYGTANQLTALSDSVPSIMFSWEKSIPFIPEMIIPYMSLDLLFGFSFLLAKTREEIQRHAIRLLFVISFSALLFLLFPLHFSLEKPAIEGWTKGIYAGLAADLPYNQLPSLHVSLSMLVGYLYFTHFKSILRWFFVAWFVLIAFSILFVFQHHFIDFPTGILAGLFTFYIIPIKGKSRIPLSFITPKHLKMGLYFLLVSVLFTVLAFKFSGVIASVLLGWIAYSMLFIAILYILAHNPMTFKNNGQIKLIYWLIFWPYLLASKLSWVIWKSKVPSMVKISDGVWIGRSLESNDKKSVHNNRIKTIIDLAPEVCDYTFKGIKRYDKPLLDLAIPDPKLVKEIINIINNEKQHGDVFVHCKFGLSRSIIVGCAWLIAQGHSKKEAWEIISQAQPLCVNKPYIHIALELFEAEI